MFKKILLVGIAMAANSTFAFPQDTYVGGSLGVGGYRSQTGITANIFGGKGTTVGEHHNIYLGGELNANIAHYARYNTMYGLGASFIPGLMLGQYTMLYGRLGLNTIYAPHTFNTLNWGTQYGAGLQTNIYKNWDVRAEYTYTTIRNPGQYNLGFVYKFE